MEFLIRLYPTTATRTKKSIRTVGFSNTVPVLYKAQKMLKSTKGAVMLKCTCNVFN
jgi:hypothetical protein